MKKVTFHGVICLIFAVAGVYAGRYDIAAPFIAAGLVLSGLEPDK